MKKSKTTKNALAKWEQAFRADAQSDGYEKFWEHLNNLELPGSPEQLLDGTILFVQMCVAYRELDGQESIAFLAQQKYEADQTAIYKVTFDINGKAYACLNLPATLAPLDLADLYGTPWNRYETVGYCDFWISRVDGEPLSQQELAALEEIVENDLRFDYDEDELDFWFDPDTHEGVLKVTVQDVYDTVA